jgi:hypothetical protein
MKATIKAIIIALVLAVSTAGAIVTMSHQVAAGDKPPDCKPNC